MCIKLRPFSCGNIYILKKARVLHYKIKGVKMMHNLK